MVFLPVPGMHKVFYEELFNSILDQACVPNSPQWFNTGLHESYGITGSLRVITFVDPADGELKRSSSAYERPCPHACSFPSGTTIWSMTVVHGPLVREARIFQIWLGCGNKLLLFRGENEKLSGGGTSSGLMSFLKIGDRAAGAINREAPPARAAKWSVWTWIIRRIMEFINWKVEEEKKVGASLPQANPSDYEGRSLPDGLRAEFQTIPFA